MKRVHFDKMDWKEEYDYDDPKVSSDEWKIDCLI